MAPTPPAFSTPLKSRPHTILWVDDYEPALDVFKLLFERQGYRVMTATRGSLALEIAAANSIDAVVTDYEMPEMDGGIVASTLKSLYPQLPVVMFTGCSSVPASVLQTVDAFCQKSDPRAALADAISGAIGSSKNSIATTSEYQVTQGFTSTTSQLAIN